MIMTAVVLVYALAELSHLPALLLLVTFGMVMSNNKLLENTFIKKFVDFRKFSDDLGIFRKMLCEFTFITRSFFFIIFGYYTQINGLFSLNNILTASLVTISLFLLRLIFIKLVLKLPAMPLVLFMPRGLITILLFLSIPLTSRIPLITEEVITLIILMTIFILMFANIISKRKITEEESITYEKVSEETMRLRDMESKRLNELSFKD
jgi:hypothetical protein